MRANQGLSLEEVKRAAPSVFAEQPWEEVSDKYRFIPTVGVLEGLMKEGFQVVSARQSNTRIEGKGEFTKHALRLRQPSSKAIRELGDLSFEVSLTNSHDRSSGFILDAGAFRLACLNGAVVAANGIQSHFSVRHSGNVGDVIEGVYEVVDTFPAIADQVRSWQGIKLSEVQQLGYATAALELSPSSIDIQARQLLAPRRSYDAAPDLFSVYNRVQEHLIKGGVRGIGTTGRRLRTREVTSIDADTKLNKALWRLTEEMAKLVA